jgi:hypothetical protein
MPENETSAPDSDVDLDEGQHEDQQPEWKPPASQEELDRIVTQRLKRETAKFKDYDTVKEQAALYNQLLASTQTDQERAAAEAEERAYNAAMGSTIPKLVRAEFRAAAKGVLEKDALDALLEDVDLTKYAGDDGEPDLEKIERKINAVKPKTPPPSFGQGARGGTSPTTNMNDFIRERAGILPQRG